MARDVSEQLTKYLTDAHSIEEQALQQLRKAPDLVGDPKIAEAFREHLRETEEHERLVRNLLEARSATASVVKDLVMRAGGAGFLLFARLQPDTPGKLVAHAYSYEALEFAAYDLLARVAELAAGDQDVASTARRIAGEERAMQERLAGLFDAAVDASLRDLDDEARRGRIVKYLSDAHAIEAQAIQLLERGPQLAGDERLAALYEEHLAETRDQQELVEVRLHALGGQTNALKDAALRLGALNWGLFFAAHPDTPGKLAAFAFAFEHLEIGGYEQLKRVAQRAGDDETVGMCDTILEQERAAAARIEALFDRAVAASLEAVGAA
jgi:ferritin-like metal-binding protein YciE